MNETGYLSYNGKRLRMGYTTGTCATAATMAAVEMILTQKPVHQVQLMTPAGVDLVLEIDHCQLSLDQASCSVVKDGGDDADATDGLDIYATVTRRQDNQITLDGGQGVGRVTKPGLKIEPGNAAINPTPRKMIQEAARQLLGPDQGVDIVISVPGGEETAKATQNPQLGILGGISILGTSGIVRPMSEDTWKESITLEMQQKKALGLDKLILTPGNYGNDFIAEHTHLKPDYIVQMSNFVGYVLLEAMRIGFTDILLVGHLGKFIKIAGGIFSTHSKDADARNEIMLANLALLGAPLDLLQAVDEAITTEAQAELILEAGYGQVYQVIVDKIKARVLKLFKFRAPDIHVEAITFLSDHDVTVMTKPLEELEAIWGWYMWLVSGQDRPTI